MEPFAVGTGSSIFDGQLADPLLTNFVLRDSPPPGDYTFGDWLFPNFAVNSVRFHYPVVGSEEAYYGDKDEAAWGDASAIKFFKPSWSKQPDKLNRYALGSAADIEAPMVSDTGVDILARNGQIARVRTLKAAEYKERAFQLASFSIGTNIGAVVDKTGSPWDQSGDMFDDIQVEARRISLHTGCDPSQLRLVLFNKARFAAVSDPILKLRRSYLKGASGVQLPEVSEYLEIGETRACLVTRGIDATGTPVEMWPVNTAILFYPGSAALSQLAIGDRLWGATFRLGVGGALPPIMRADYAGLGVAWRVWEKTRIIDPYCASAFTNVWSK